MLLTESVLDQILVFLTAATPVLEVRVAIPLGISLGFTPLSATVISFLGSIFPSPFILFTIKRIFRYLKKNPFLHRLTEKITVRALEKGGSKIQKYGIIGLFIFVAIPLPGTGVWTGSIAAAFLDLEVKSSLLAIILGNLVATILIVALSDSLFKLLT